MPPPGTTTGLEFFTAMRPLARFSEGLDGANFHRLPDGWLVGVAYVVDSTSAIAVGRYKAVNMVGAGVIAGVLNVLDQRSFPFAFSGDGAAWRRRLGAGRAGGRRYRCLSAACRRSAGQAAAAAGRGPAHSARGTGAFLARAGRFDPAHYRARVVTNSDYRKFEDGLKLTVDCTPAEADQIEALLEAGRRAGICRFGLHRQDAAIMTCLVPSYVRDDHFHFIDGAGGGYAAAATMLKRSPSAPDD